jgi:hypothetical protein
LAVREQAYGWPGGLSPARQAGADPRSEAH